MQAGATVIGVDHKPQSHFPGVNLIECDVTDPCKRSQLMREARLCDFIWASPPCQFGSVMRHAPNAKQHKNLIPWTRDFIAEARKPYVIENVEGARKHLYNPVCLCGSMFGLGVWLQLKDRAIYAQLERHRYFETSWPYEPPGACQHSEATIGVYGSHARIRAASIAGGRGTSWPFRTPQNEAAACALGAVGEGLTLAEMSQGVPPAYAEHILNSWKASRV